MSFKLPIKTDWMEKQMNHEPTRAYAEQIHNVVKKLNPENSLEIGCAWGVSTLAILLGNPDCTLESVDLNPKTRADQEVLCNGFEHRWTFINSDSKSFWDNTQREYDLIYIDGSHKYSDVRNDLFKAWERTKILLIDDVTHKANKEWDKEADDIMYGISLACWELVLEKKIEKIKTEGKLAYFLK